VKLHHYDQMMAYLTRRQKFSKGGDVILPQPNPLSPQERNQKVFNDYVGRMKKYLADGVDMPEWFVKDLITQKAEELGVELKAEGGRLKAAGPLLLAPYLLPYAATFLGAVGATAAWNSPTGLALQQKIQNYFEDKPEEVPKFKEYLKSQNVQVDDSEPTNWSQSFADDITHKSVPVDVGGETYIGDRGEKEAERERILQEEKKKYQDIKSGKREEINVPTDTGHPPPEIKKWEPPVNIPPKLADVQLPPFPDQSDEFNVPQIFTSETAQAKEKTAQTLEDLLKEHAAKAAAMVGKKKTDWTTDEEFIKTFNEYMNKYFGGNRNAAAKSIGQSREKIRGIEQRLSFEKKGTFSYGHTATGSEMRLNVSEPTDGIAYIDATTLAKKDSNFLKKFITEENAGEFMSAKEIAHSFGVKFKEGEQGRKQLDQLVKDLKRFNVESQHYSSRQSLFNFEDAVNKITEGYKKKLVEGDIESMSKRIEIQKRLDSELFNVDNKIKARIRVASKNNDIYIQGAIDDIGHTISIKITDKYPELFKNNDVNKIGTRVYQDPYTNRDVMRHTGYESKFDSMFKELDKLLNKPVTAETQAQILEIKEKMKANYENLIDTISSPKKLKKIMADAGKEITSSHLKKISKQTDRIPRIDVKVPKIGEIFLSENLFTDMSNVDPVWIIGNVDKINPDARYFKDLSLEQQALYEANMLEQSANILEDYYKKAKFSKEQIDELRETLSEAEGYKTKKYSTGGPIYGKYADQIKKLKIS